MFARNLILVFTALCWLSSCNIINPPEATPAYVYIPRIDLQTNPAVDGSNAHKITDAWVYLNGDLVGPFELPATIPVLKDGTGTLIVKPGIKVNGISNTHAYYSFYLPYETDLNFIPGQIDTIIPVTSYYPEKVNWIEDFEDGGVTIEKYGNSDTIVEKTNSPPLVFEGSYSGVIYLEPSRDHFLGASTEEYEFKKGSDPVFLEMNYKTNNTMAIGVIAMLTGNVTKIPALVINPNDNWNKIYINLTNVVNLVSANCTYKIYFEIASDEGVTYPVTYIDNIKLVYNRP